jgi:hypothetical protein
LAVDAPDQPRQVLAAISDYLEAARASNPGYEPRVVDQDAPPHTRLRFEIFNQRLVNYKSYWLGSVALRGGVEALYERVPSLLEPLDVTAVELERFTDTKTNDHYLSVLFDAESKAALYEEQSNVFVALSKLSGVGVHRKPKTTTAMRLAFFPRNTKPASIVKVEKAMELALPMTFRFEPARVPTSVRPRRLQR